MVRVVALAYLWDPAARPWLEAQPGCGAASCVLHAATNPTGAPVAAAAGYFTHTPPTDPPASVRFIVAEGDRVTGGNVPALLGQPYAFSSFLSATATTLGGGA